MTDKDKSKNEPSKFTGVFLPAGLLAMPHLSSLEKIISADVGYFRAKENGYRFSNEQMARKFGCSRRAIINALNRITVRPNRLKSHKPELELIIDTGDYYHRCLKLNGAISALFEQKKDGRSRFSKNEQPIEKSRAETKYEPGRRNLAAVPESAFGTEIKT